MDLQLLNETTAFVWLESDLLDHGEYAQWLDLWAEGGVYVIPIAEGVVDFENTLNYAYDDDEMRRKRVARLESGKSISATPRARTVRSVSRLRVLGEEAGVVTVRCAQDLAEFRKGRATRHTADVTYELRRTGEGFRIQRKVIRLVNSADALTTTGFLL